MSARLKKSKSLQPASSKKFAREARIKVLPPNFYQNLIEAENDFYCSPSKEGCANLLLLYKTGAEYYGKVNRENEQIFVKSMQKILSSPMAMKLYAKEKSQSSDKKPANQKPKNQLKYYLENFHLNLVDFTPKAKEIIQTYKDSLKKAYGLYKKSEALQKDNFKNRIKQKAFDNQLVPHDDMEAQHRHHHGHTSSQLSNLGDYTRNRASTIIERKTKLPQNDYVKRRTSVQVPEPEQSSELVDFLKDYSKKLHFLFQTNINETGNELNIILDEGYRKKITKHFEYLDNLGEFELMKEDNGLEESALNDLIKGTTNDYLKEKAEIEDEVNKKVEQLCKKKAKKKLKDNITISNLNAETLGKVVKVFQ